MFVAILLCTTSVLYAQENDYTQYFTNLSSVNPAFTGMDDFFVLNAGVREGWNSYGIKNDNSYLSFFGALNNGNRAARRNNSLRTSDPSMFESIQNEKKYRRRHGMGGMITNRVVDAYHSFGAFFNYSYHLPLTGKLNISFGTRAGYSNQRIDFGNLTVRDDINDKFYQSLLQAGQGNQNTFMIDFGTMIYSRKFFLGFSSNNLVANKLNGDQLYNMTTGTRYRTQLGIFIPLNSMWELSPGAQAVYQDGYDLQWIASVRLKYKDLIYLGSAFNPDSKVAILVGLTAQKISINYAYDIYIGGLNNFDVNTHELVLGINLFNRYKLQSRFW